jgi:hypothetical protein
MDVGTLRAPVCVEYTHVRLGVAPEVGVVLAAHEDSEERVPMAPEVGAAGGGAEKSRGAVE